MSRIDYDDEASSQGERLFIQPARRYMPPVRQCFEFARIAILPRWPEVPLIDESTLKKKNGEMSLRPLQHKALSAAYFAGGLFAPIGVGGGKTLISALLPTVLDKRALILVPASLRDQTTDLILKYSKHWQLRRDLDLISYETLSRADTARVLDEIKPELIIADEVHSLRAKDAARTKRFLRYMQEHPGTLFCAMSGTITKRSIRDFGHLLELVLGEASPLPRSWNVLSEWAEALDVSDRPRPPGAILKLSNPTPNWTLPRSSSAAVGASETSDPTAAARKIWRQRFVETMGVVASEEDALGQTLIVNVSRAPKSEKNDAARKALDATWTRPDGEELVTALDFARVDRQLRLGGFYRWVTPPPFDWKQARAEWHRALRSFLAHKSQEGLDSPLLVSRAIKAKDPRVAKLELFYQTWVAIKDTIPEPEVEWEWVDEDFIQSVLEKCLPRTKSIVWTDIVAVGEKAAKVLGVPWFGAGADNIINQKNTRHIVASIKAHGTGKNLQKFSSNLLLGCPSAGAAMEQLIGRTHRPGQEADEVHVQVLDLYKDELVIAANDTKYIEELTGSKQKLNYCIRGGW